MNLIVIKGRLTRDPELKRTETGVAVCNIAVAVDRSYSADGEKKTDFFDCVFWRQGAEFISKYFTKGKEIIVRGEMQSRKWQDKDGNNRTSWEIQNCHAEFCGGKSSQPNGNADYVPPVQVADNDYALLEGPDGNLPF